MSSLSVPALKPLKLPTIPTRAIVRVIGSVVLVGALVIDGPSIAGRIVDGKVVHYTVVLKPGSDTSAAVSQAKHHGATIRGFNAKTAAPSLDVAIREDKASALKSDPNVAYIQSNNEQRAQKSWWVAMRDRLSM